jgi:hypothetical protein
MLRQTKLRNHRLGQHLRGQRAVEVQAPLPRVRWVSDGCQMGVRWVSDTFALKCAEA